MPERAKTLWPEAAIVIGGGQATVSPDLFDRAFIGDDNTFADAVYAGDLADAIQKAGIKKELSSYCRVDHICKHLISCRSGMTSAFGLYVHVQRRAANVDESARVRSALRPFDSAYVVLVEIPPR